jgi:3'-5' exoribonuclease
VNSYLGEEHPMADIYSYDKKQKEQTLIKADEGKRQKEIFIENLKEGDVITELFSVKLKSPPRTYRKGSWFGFVALDKTGSIDVKFWGGDNKERVKRLYDSFNVGDVIKIRSGTVELYNEKLQISINETSGGLRRCGTEEYLVSDFLPALDESEIETLYTQLKTYMSEIGNEQLQLLLQSFFSDKEFEYDFTHMPSAMTHHHNYIGGNLQHTVGVVRLCDNICRMYPQVNKDLAVTGAILHDLGKLKEYKTTTSIEKTGIGNFIGHIVIGDRWIRKKVAEIRETGKKFDEDLEMYLCHMILSHHGRMEYGSPSIPKIAEAVVLSQADLMDSQVKNFLQVQENHKKQSDDEWAFIWDAEAGRKKAMYLGDLSPFLSDE